MTWALRLRQVFKIDSETCDVCGGAVKMVARKPVSTLQLPVKPREPLINYFSVIPAQAGIQ